MTRRARRGWGGRRSGSGLRTQIYAVLAALEPEATAERRAQLMIEAKSQVRAPVQYFDATFSVSKSITLLHASAMANAARAAAEGDLEAAGVLGAGRRRQCGRACRRGTGRGWSTCSGRRDTPGPGTTAAGRAGRTGRWEDAHGFIVGSFAQHTSRDGDPQLHIHNLILNRVMRETRRRVPDAGLRRCYTSTAAPRRRSRLW